MATPKRRNLVRRNQRLAAQIGAINQLHDNRDGVCAYCGTAFPCDTRAVMQTARQVADTPVRERDEAKAASRAGVDAILERRTDAQARWPIPPYAKADRTDG